jgi:signal recognition particle subunit SRP54
VSRLLGYGDMKQLFNMMQDVGIDNQPELMNRLKEGVFTMRDMSDQFQSNTPFH